MSQHGGQRTLRHVLTSMTADCYATCFCSMLELAVASFCHDQSPSISFEHANHVTYLHVATISQARKSIPVLHHASPSACYFGCLTRQADRTAKSAAWLRTIPTNGSTENGPHPLPKGEGFGKRTVQKLIRCLELSAAVERFERLERFERKFRY